MVRAVQKGRSARDRFACPRGVAAVVDALDPRPLRSGRKRPEICLTTRSDARCQVLHTCRSATFSATASGGVSMPV